MDKPKNLYTVTITETLSKEVEVEAASQDEAEQITKENWRSGDYILDAGNFVDVEFEARPAELEEEKGNEMNAKITVLLVEPMALPQVVELDNTLKAMQQTVGGDIEAVYPFDDRVVLVCNEEGKLMGLQPNRGLYNSAGQLQDTIVGSFFLCGDGEENFASLTPAQLEKYTALFAQPQDFVFRDGRIVPVPAQVAPAKAELTPPAFKRPAPKKSKPSKNRGGNAR